MPRPVSLAAERAVRLLREADSPVDSVRLAREILATSAPDETTARRVLEAAFSGDSRLIYEGGGWQVGPGERPAIPDPDRALVFVEGGRPAPGEPYLLTSVAALRLSSDEVIAACGGEPMQGPGSNRLRRAVLEILDGAVPVLHDPPGSVGALEEWLGEPLAAPVLLRRIARQRLGLPARHDLEQLAARLDLPWRATDDPLEMADTLDSCLSRLRDPEVQ